MRKPGLSRLATGYTVLFVVCVLGSVGLLAAGAVVLLVDQVPSIAERLAEAAAQGDRWARGVREALPSSEPLGQAALDYTFSLISLVIAAALLASRNHAWPIRLLALAMVAAAGAFNLQAYAGAVAVQTATGLPVDGLYRVGLHAVAYVAYLSALLLFPSGRLPGFGSRSRRTVTTAMVGALLLVGVVTALLPRSISCVAFFGFLVPLLALGVLPHGRIRPDLSTEQRAQVRLLFSVLAALLPVAVVLIVVTQLLSEIRWSGLTLQDATTTGGAGTEQPMVLLFWFARFVSVAVAAAVLVVTRRAALWTAERVLGLWLAATLVVVLVGSLFVVVDTVAGKVAVELFGADIAGAFLLVTVVATALEALSFLPVQVGAERLVDRLLYGTRPTPYSVLADIASQSRSTPREGADLTRVAEGIARGLGATTCRLTVTRPGLRDRTYTWTEPGAGPAPEDLVEVPVCQGEERVGAIAVDRGAVVGLYAQRRGLLTDIADSLGVVMQANRAGVELERHLRVVLAHAEDIAASRRRAVAEMDSERRRIERDLHDGAQLCLVSLRLTLGLVEHQVATAQFDQARSRLDQAAAQITSAAGMLAATAAGVSSPVLSERGLVAALETELSSGHTPVDLDVDGLDPRRRYPENVETAVYFCCLESVNNARKHAPGATVSVRLATAGNRLFFTVRDDGPGYDPTAMAGSPGHGLRNVQARMGAVGGRIEIRSWPGTGTTVEGWVPLPADRSERRDEFRAPGHCSVAGRPEPAPSGPIPRPRSASPPEWG
jgi:signal transduction histidine kinase